ncbi:MAG TPA: tRNA pseudouridine(55) synthase TruB [Pyrinomonadaceae bacterium]|jgi:tRNA pseudouridine55 synthase|nr:tRNA pseudouridine(55) synthase TruB [Pyrinomonadaceae bacterium]
MDGIVIIDKPEGWTSHDVVARARRLLGERRIGHTGTLDPFATGVLVLLVGRATRLAQFLAGAEKEYEAVIRLGYATDTGDLTGTPRQVETRTTGDYSTLSAAEIEKAIEGLRGQLDQVPPMYSAKKVKGQKLYEMARRGEEIERAPVRVTVFEFEAIPREGGTLLRRNEDGTCDLSARVVCSAGTYIRALAESLGDSLGTGAHLAALRRTRAGAFSLQDAISVESLKEISEAGATEKILLSPNAALSNMPFVHLTSDETERVRHGASIRVNSNAQEWQDGELIRMRDAAGELLAVGVYKALSGQLHPRVLLNPA